MTLPFRCDGKRPACSQCVLTGRTCDGYQSDWTFVPQGTSGKQSTARPCQQKVANIKRTVDANSRSSTRRRPKSRQQVEPELLIREESLSLIRPHGRPCMTDVAEFVRNGYLPEILNTLSDSAHKESRICGAWVDVLPQLPCLASDASVLSKATLALATLINSQRRSLSRTCDVESPQSYYDAIHKMRGHIATNGLSLELLPAIMCLTLVELMLPDSASALNMHIHAIRILFQNYGPGTFSSGLLHQLFLGFRPFIIAEALRDRQPTFLATSIWINIPFSINAVTPTQELYSEIAAIPSILQEIDMLGCVSSTENIPASRVLIGSLFEASKRLCAWENALGLNIIPSVTSFSDLQPISIKIPQTSPTPIWFPNIPIANGMTHCWSVRVICLLEIDKILSRLPNCTVILEGLSEEINPISIRAEGDRLAFLICSSMNYLFQNEMKLFGPALALFPTQIAYAWFERHRACNGNSIDFIKGVVAQLVQRGLLSAPRLVLGESSI
ncbi:hypothetical protein ACN38_g8430 [Penicillium nordicum]|uniref:Zn(2)-C6 fungal-type domain-containing protein n=1 Tax=Penicillium nordicum TaxID=229535 RepID=A0A0M8P4T8_9EURO|nr:hypothetical protein ACN38_g8430 [Penicillium nordicum]